MDDQNFLRAILANPDDDTLRLVYADWLEEQGDPRAEFLRLEVLVGEAWMMPKDQPAKNAQARLRLAKLVQQVDADWRALLDRPWIENCHELRFWGVCPSEWKNLETTEDARVRLCQMCRRNVYWCDSVKAAREYASQGECVAIDSRAERGWGDLVGENIQDEFFDYLGEQEELDREKAEAKLGRPRSQRKPKRHQ